MFVFMSFVELVIWVVGFGCYKVGITEALCWSLLSK